MIHHPFVHLILFKNKNVCSCSQREMWDERQINAVYFCLFKTKQKQNDNEKRRFPYFHLLNSDLSLFKGKHMF